MRNKFATLQNVKFNICKIKYFTVKTNNICKADNKDSDCDYIFGTLLFVAHYLNLLLTSSFYTTVPHILPRLTCAKRYFLNFYSFTQIGIKPDKFNGIFPNTLEIIYL